LNLLLSISIEETFELRGLKIIGETNQNSSKKNIHYIDSYRIFYIRNKICADPSEWSNGYYVEKIGQRSPQVIGSIPARGQNCLDSSEYQAIVISQF